MTNRKPGRRISIRTVRKDPPDLGKLGRALLALAMAQAEADAQADQAAKTQNTDKNAATSEDET